MSYFKKSILETHCDRLSFNFYTFNNVLSDKELNLKSQGRLKSNASLHDSVVTGSLLSAKIIADNHLRFNPKISYGEDNLFMFEFNLSNPIQHHLLDTVYFYRFNSTSAMHTISPEGTEKQITSFIEGAFILKDYYSQRKGNLQVTANTLMSFCGEP